MSFIAAILLLNMEEVDAFMCFANLLNKPCQLAFFRLDENVVSSKCHTYRMPQPLCCRWLIWPIKNDAKIPEKWLKSWHIGTHLIEYSTRAIQWMPRWQGWDSSQKSLHPCPLDKSSLSIWRLQVHLPFKASGHWFSFNMKFSKL